MARNTKDPLKDLSQADIDIVMAKKCADRTSEETRVYKKVKMNTWLEKRGKIPSKPKKIVSAIKVIPFVLASEQRAAKKEQVPRVPIMPKAPPKLSNGKLPNWVRVPVLTNELKQWTEGRTIIIGQNGKSHIARLNWLKNDEMPTVSMSGVPPFFFNWPNAFVTVKHGFIRQYERDAIIKNEAGDEERVA